jgi:hypothetical protein
VGETKRRKFFLYMDEFQYFTSDLNQKRLRVPVHELHIDFERRSARIAPEASLACEALDRAVPRTCGGVLDTMASSLLNLTPRLLMLEWFKKNPDAFAPKDDECISRCE